MTKPNLKEATQDLTNIRSELEAMRRIEVEALWLAGRDDVDSNYYRSLWNKVKFDISKGEGVEKLILKHYPELL